ncbi:penicillin acylase family protein [Xylanimonas oleitrophica]|uniref:penicillin acylase family protein n=1 Tax=Xylanimonas oleitrophica TaxID=2607479 RepID=UPI0015D02A38|nr:penicillin acylase family protein [Xylanimonas oleitrophica]
MSAPTTPAEPSEQSPTPAPRRSRSRLRRAVVGIAVIVLLAIVATVTFTAVVIRRPLPETSGSLQLDGLEREVTVTRDEQGVPRIYADTAEDLFRAQGYVQAQDRFFEMDYRRHVTSGRLAELVGDVPAAIEADKVVRTFGWRQVAQQELDLVSDETRSYLRAYAEGVNAYLQGRDAGDIAFEYTVLGTTAQVEPEPWDPVDSLAWLKAMAWDLRGNYDDELDRALAYSTLDDVALVNELFPPYEQGGNATVLDPADLPESESGGAGAPVDVATAQTTSSPAGPSVRGARVDDALASARAALEAVPVLVGRGEGTGSNAWVVSGEHTSSGAPMLANDPHLALGAPGIWAQVGLHCTTVGADCPFDVAGFSFAGFPGVMIGHNGQLAWGLTNMGADVTDFFVERVRGETYQRGEEWVPLEVRRETIRVAGSAAVDIDVRSTVHGPVISDVLEVGAVTGAPSAAGTALGSYAVSLAWTALTPGRTADAVFALNTAQDAEDVREAAALFDVPAQNIVFATADGHIGYQAPGRIPVRAEVPGSPVPSDGSWPRDGRDPAYDWQGWVPAEQMPRALDPESGFIVTANQAVLPAGTGPFLTNDWDYGFRSERIRALLTQQIDSGRPFGVEDFNNIQNDDWSPYAQVLLPALLDVQLDDDYDAAGQELLRGWDGRMAADSAPAAYFAAVWRNLLQATFWDDLPQDMRPDGGDRWLVVLRTMLENPDDRFWDDRSTLNVVESRDEILTQALVSARRDMTVEMAKDPSRWSWGKLHTLRLEHPILGGEGVPGLVRELVNPSPVEMSGSSSVVNATGWDAGTGSFAVRTGPSMRMVVDLGDIDDSTWVTVTGTSGHPASKHYADQLGAWAEGRTFPFAFTRDAVQETAREELTLTP